MRTCDTSLMSQLSHPASVDTANSSHNSAVLIIDVNKSPSSEQRNAPPCMFHLCLVMGNTMVTVCFYGVEGNLGETVIITGSSH